MASPLGFEVQSQKKLTFVKEKQVIRQKFETYRRVMFNAEEIKLRRYDKGKTSMVR